MLAMKTSIIITVFAVILCSSLRGTGQTVQHVTLYSGTNSAGVECSIQTNQVVSLVGYDWYDSPSVSGNLPDGTRINLVPQNRGFAAGGGVAWTPVTTPQTFTGITNVSVQPSAGLSAGLSGWATFQITTPASANVISNYVPADAIVIPASATGNVEIILESSTDLLNWTAANPGTYSAASATNRFFRVRGVHN
jgi:hypothetical protein